MKKNSKVSYFIIISLVSFFYYYNIGINYCYASTRTEEEQFLSWLGNNDYGIEENNRRTLLDFFRIILDRAINNKASVIIHILAGNSHYSNREDDIDINNSNRLLFLDKIPDGNPVKLQIYSDLNRIANLAKVGNTREIISLLNTIEYPIEDEEEHIVGLSPITLFPLDRKDSLIRFFRRMDNDITRNTLHHLFDVYEAVEDNNLREAINLFGIFMNKSHKLYSYSASLLNLEDFGAGYRSFDIWLNEMNRLLATLNLENKPRINILLDYLNIANVSYFKPKTTMLIGSFFYSSRIDNEIDGAILCNGYK